MGRKRSAKRGRKTLAVPRKGRISVVVNRQTVIIKGKSSIVVQGPAHVTIDWEND